MSQLEQSFRRYLARRPEVARCMADGLMNRRSLARHLVEEDVVKQNQMDAVIAMIRRFDFKEAKRPKAVFDAMRITLKDKIFVLDFDKDKLLLRSLQNLITLIDYDKGETFKIVIGTSAIKVIVDKGVYKKLKSTVNQFTPVGQQEVSELSLMFTSAAQKSQGVVCAVTTELAINNVTIVELLTASPELLIYVDDEDALKAYEVLKGFKC